VQYPEAVRSNLKFSDEDQAPKMKARVCVSIVSIVCAIDIYSLPQQGGLDGLETRYCGQY
jgi:hypothetical protein